MMRWLSTVLLAFVMTFSVIATTPKKATPRKAAPQRTMKTVKKEQQATQRSLKETQRKIEKNTSETQRQLSELTRLDGEIKIKDSEINTLQNRISTLDARMAQASDTIALYKGQLTQMQQSYAQALRRMQGYTHSSGIISYIFSAKSYRQAMARMRYIREMSQWRKRRAHDIQLASQRLASQRQHLGELADERRQSLTQLNNTRGQLSDTRKNTDRLVASLKRQGKDLESAMRNGQKRLQQLDRELDRLIEAEQRRREAQEQRRKQKAAEAERRKQDQRQPQKPEGNAPKSTAPATAVTGVAADRELTGSFENNRGRLLFPVRGSYTIVRGFGRQQHPELPHVVTENSGIDICAGAGAQARAIFDGQVSGVFAHDGYGTIVMVRHGSYISIYANLQGASVKTGDKVKSGQTIGIIAPDATYSNRPTLHFELRKERTKLNPTQWVK